MNGNTRPRKSAFITVAAIGLGVFGTYAVGSVLHMRSHAVSNAEEGALLGRIH